MPMWLLIAVGGPAAVATTYCTWVLSRLAPMYFETAQEAPSFGLEGTIVGLALLGLGIMTWNFAEIANACGTEVRKRTFV